MVNKGSRMSSALSEKGRVGHLRRSSKPGANAAAHRLDRIPSDEVVLFTRQLAVMLTAGIALHRALEFYGGQGPGPMHQLIAGAAGEISRGQRMSTALLPHVEVFGVVYIAMVVVAEQSGQLVPIFRRLADLLEQQRDVRRKTVATLTYPALLLGCSLLAILIFVTFILPMTTPLLTSNGGELPLATRMLLASRGFIVGSSLLLCAAGLGLRYAKKPIREYLERDPELLKSLHQLPLSLPSIGDVVFKLLSARVLYATATMLEAGLTVTSALTKAADASGNKVMAARVAQAIEAITEGAPIAEALAQYRVFPPTAVQMIAIGEESGTMLEMFRYVANHFDDEVETSLRQLASLVEPLVMLGMGVLVGFVALGAIMPTISVLQKM